MSEFDEMLSIATAAVQESQPAAETPAEVPAAEPETKVEPETSAGGDGSGAAETAVAKTEAAPAEKPAETPKPEEKKTDWKAAAAAEREKRAAREAQKSQAAKNATELESVKQKLARWEAIEAKKQSNLLEAAREAGFDYEKLTNEYIKTLDPKHQASTPQIPEEVKALNQKFQQLEEAFNQQRNAILAERQQQVVSGFMSEVKTTLQAKGDEFELTRTAEEGPDLVRSIVAAHWRKTAELDKNGRPTKEGETLSVDEACRLAEEYFEKQQLKRFAETKKFKALAKTETPKLAEKKPEQVTLSNSLRQGGVQPSFSGEFEELAALARKLEAQQGN